MVSTALVLLLIAYVPGALLFRLPVARAEQRGMLSAEERVFWAVMLSLAVTSVVALTLAIGGAYRLDRLVIINGILSGLVVVVVGRRGLKLPPEAPRISVTALVPIGLAALAFGIFFHVPPAEFVIGGRDPGIYVNEGIQIAQRGAVVVEEPLVASVPPESRGLFFRVRARQFFDRFLAFFIVDFDGGRVVGQFPHLYPVWVGIGYGVNGLSGARQVGGLLAIVGVLAVYFSGAWLVGRGAAALGVTLLLLNVAEVWFSRYPNSEVLMQLLVFGALLAYGRASVEDDRFFAPVAAVLLSLAVFGHLSSVLVVGGICVAAGLGLVDGRRLMSSFLVPLGLGLALAAWYFGSTLDGYLARPRAILGQASLVHAAGATAAGLAGAAFLVAIRRERVRLLLRAWIPWIVLAPVLGLAAYAYFVREPVARLAPHDAHALRDFAAVYLSPVGLLLAMTGLVVVMRTAFWRGLAFLMVTLVFAAFVFYKIRIFPEHFWLARRYLPVVLPAACLLIGTTVLAPLTVRLPGPLDRRAARIGLMAVLMVALGWVGTRFIARTQPIFSHVEYAGVIPQLEKLDTEIGDDDLVLVEARERSDLHVLAVPLAYVYGAQTLQLAVPSPDPRALTDFLAWAWERYNRVLFIGGGSSRVISRSVDARHVLTDRLRMPEYARTYPDVPDEARTKQLDIGLYELIPRRRGADSFDLDVGSQDDLYVFGFHGAEQLGDTGPTFRWTRAVSSVLVPEIRSDTSTVTAWLGAGTRPANAPLPVVTISLGARVLGTVAVTPAMRRYAFEVPPDYAGELAASRALMEVFIAADTWSPAEYLGSTDERELGVMVDRVTVD